MHIEVQVTSKCLCHNGTQWTADEFQRVLELNAIVLDLHFLVFSGWNDFQISRHCGDEFHDECEIVVRSIVKVDWQTIVLLVERELQVAFGATGADVLPSFEMAYFSLPCGVFTCHMCMMSNLGYFHRIVNFPVVLFHMAEGTHGCCTKDPLDARRVLEGSFIEEICFHSLVQLCEIVHERTKVYFAFVWCMEDSQLAVNGWNA